MSAFNIKTADLFLPGNYRVEVLRVFQDKDSAGKSCFVVETLVIKSDNPKISIGDEREWICPWEHGPHYNHIKAFVGAAQGLGPKANSITNEMVDIALFWLNPLENAQLNLHCYYSRQASTGRKFLAHCWAPLKNAKVGQLPRCKKNSWLSKSQRPQAGVLKY